LKKMSLNFTKINYCGFSPAVFAAHCFGFADFHYPLHLRAHLKVMFFFVVMRFGIIVCLIQFTVSAVIFLNNKDAAAKIAGIISSSLVGGRIWRDGGQE